MNHEVMQDMSSAFSVMLLSNPDTKGIWYQRLSVICEGIHKQEKVIF